MESPKRVIIEGRVKAGFGRGKQFMAEKGYREQFIRKLGIDPIRGTLNIFTRERDKLKILKGLEGIKIEGFVSGETDFGEVKAFPAEVEGLKSAVVIPKRTTHESGLEIISEHHLREELEFKDGNRLSVTIFLE